MAITLTPAALDHVRRFLARSPLAAGLRFGVKRTGCSGWGYVVDIADARREGDTAFEFEGVTILVDADSLPLVDGTRIDYVRQGLNHQFAFENPNVAAACGCGESFTTDAAA
ncbi:HesB/IscA family protein [Rehaibacterium terrae]|jgi:iron-sulfur cluster assembly protein|uniref:Iron-sulfur cluster assembly protein n=1 Tax=Rehaibacterium terrae TaxID=1341696 RepID=A0A7W7Y190_9GAMM|nr:iron-sulfur cluster assembly accessory protein [Rehaibacterium terrae]MBB5016237.1 iron-sulfur cluster assembly protein [Rehaibacterium terrae]